MLEVAGPHRRLRRRPGRPRHRPRTSAPASSSRSSGPTAPGKTTTMLALGGVLPPTGEVHVRRASRSTGPLHRRARRGLGFITEERAVFRQLSTRTNLELGSRRRRRRPRALPGARAAARPARRVCSREASSRCSCSRGRWRREPRAAARRRALARPRADDRAAAARRAPRGRRRGHGRPHRRAARPTGARASPIAPTCCSAGAVELEGTGAELLSRLGEIERTYLGGLGPVDGT